MRLPTQLCIGDRVRARIEIPEIRPFAGGVDVVSELTFESDRAEKTVCWLAWIGRGYETRTRLGPGCEA